MSFNAGAITGSIGLNTSPLSDSIARSKGILGRFKGSTDRTFSAIKASIIGNLVGGLGSTAITSALRGLSSRISAALSGIDLTSKTARSLGITTEALSGLQHGMALSGGSAEGLATALKMMQNNVADAARGVGTAKPTLDLLGLSIDALVSARPEEGLGMIADALGAIETPAMKTQAAMDIFGRQAGPELLALLEQGSAGLEAFQRRAAELGLTFTEIDARKVEIANDALMESGRVIQGLVQKAAIEVAPYIHGIATGLTDAGVAGGGFGEQVTSAIEWVVGGIAKAADYLNRFRIGFKVVQIAATGVFEFILQGTRSIRDVMADGIMSMLNIAADVASKIPGIGDSIAAGLRKAAAAGGVLRDFENAWADELTSTRKRLQRELKDLWNAPALGDRVSDFFADARARAEEVARKIAEAGERAGRGFKEPITEAIEEVQKALEVETFAQIYFVNSAEELSLRQRQVAAAAGAGPGHKDYSRLMLVEQKEIKSAMLELVSLYRGQFSGDDRPVQIVGF